MAKKEHRKPSYPAALRMARIAFELPSHPFGWSLEAIRRDLDISERTLKRYLHRRAKKNSLTAWEGPTSRSVPTAERPNIRLARAPKARTVHRLAQAVSLYFTLTLLKFLEGTVLEEGIEDLWDGVHPEPTGVSSALTSPRWTGNFTRYHPRRGLSQPQAHSEPDHPGPDS